MKAYLMTLKGVVGENGLHLILNYAHLENYSGSFPPDNEKLVIPLKDLQKLLLSLYELFGSKGVRSLQIRVGHFETKHL